MTASPEQLVVMLYDGAVKFLRQARHALGEKAYSSVHEKLGRAEAILDELIATLKMDVGEFAQRLQSIYLFCKRYLAEVRLEREPGKIDKVIEIMLELRGAWAGIIAEGTRTPAVATSLAA